MSKEPTIYALVGPDGLYRGIYESQQDAWHQAFQYQGKSFEDEYWNRGENAREAMFKLGWRVVTGRFVENGKET